MLLIDNKKVLYHTSIMDKEVIQFPQSKDYELALILEGGDYLNLKNYLSNYLKIVFSETNTNKPDSEVIRDNLFNKLPVIIERFMSGGGPNKDYKFSSYFSWYISQELERLDN
ncbi:MAG: hypothetical protein UU42_C0016G0012 [Candidatus Woesebacteria bacterium GW2011_GWA1_41_13b]|uniref:Uncharacterized protein n=2 Tax=Patescibacteria group TaxID=1783273 RepID=A0A0G0URA8_9BACT|nr:MAG: hypothetical protein UU42_C0016G0012 [Candidatus Woesebacteria bacterium GW2011_GWA1_41_13b]